MRKRLNKNSQTEDAEYWGISQKTISEWSGKGFPASGTRAEQAAWISQNAKRKNQATKKRLAEFIKSSDGDASDISLEAARDFYSRELNAAMKAKVKDSESIKLWTDLLIKSEKCIRESEAHAKKLGLDKGELLSRGEVERILRAVAWSGNACIDKFSKQIAQRLSDKKPAEVHRILKPTLTALTLFEAMKRVTKTPGEVNLPEWVTACFATEEKQYLK